MEKRSGRAGWQYAAHALAIVLLVLVPLGLAFALSPQATTTAVLIYLPVASFGLGLYDATTFRPTWSFPVCAGAYFWVSTLMFYDPGAWIYALGVAAVCGLGEFAAARLGAR